MFESVNVLNELRRENDSFVENSILEEATAILKKEEQREEQIRKDIHSSHGIRENCQSGSLPSGEIFHISAIEKICTRYRLRFLKSSAFKGDIPYEAIRKIKSLQKNDWKGNQFYLMAPASRFRLKDSKEDPLLFARIDEERFLFIHQWGNDLKWYKRIMAFPMSNMQNLVISVISIAFLLALFVPGSWSGNAASLPHTFLFKSALFFMFSGLLFCFSLIYGILSSKDFSNDIWDDQYFN